MIIDMDKEFILSSPKGRANSKFIKKHFPKEYEIILGCNGETFSEKLYNYFYNSPSHICPVCGKDTPFRSLIHGYSKFCSTKCSYKSPLRIQKSIQTCIERYGVENPSQSDIIKKKKEETCLKNYGVESGLQTKIAKNNLKETCLKNYGVENPSQSDIIKKKKEETYLKNYGVENVLKLEEVRKKGQESLLEKYGVKYAFQDSNIRKKAIDKHRNRFLGKWDLHIGYTETGDWICKCPHITCDKCIEKQFIINQVMFHDRMKNQSEICTKLLKPGSTNQGTTIELFIRSILDEYNIEYKTNVRDIIPPKELDIYIPLKNIAIECNGIFWHSKKPTNYHLNKFNECFKHGIQLLTIWEDWIKNKPEIIKSIILSKLGIYKKRIYARKCIVKEIDSKTCNNFLDHNHIQGKSPSSIKLGLFYNNELISIMTFGKSRLGIGQSNNGYELIRFCNKQNTQVIGGASKLFYFFVKKYNPNNIYSYSSNDISNGNLYKQLKFKTNNKINQSYWYINQSTFERFHRFNFRKQKLKEMGYNIENQTEYQIMENLPYWRIYDSGTKTWIFDKK